MAADVAPRRLIPMPDANAWDAIVIGAGPAGSLAAYLLARAQVKVLLVERKLLPRPKVCGGCLNAHALAALERAGLADRVRARGAMPLHRIRLHQRTRMATLDLPPGLAVSRSALDAELAAAAVEAGCVLMSETSALVVPEGHGCGGDGRRRVMLQQRHGGSVMASARAIVAADGLAHRALRECPSFIDRVSPASRIGVGGEGEAGAVAVEPGCITMAVGRRGYVGAVVLETGRVNVAAAVDPEFLKAQPSTASAVRVILSEAGVGYGAALDAIDWLGTVPLSRRLSRPAAPGIFVVGDAAGYVEPFTGEGMAWAFAGAEAVVPFVTRAVDAPAPGLDEAWARAYAATIGRQQRWCRAAARVLRMPALVTPLLVLLRGQPRLARPVLAHFAPRAASSHGGIG
jgi:flavin-dependent dehydrogenase